MAVLVSGRISQSFILSYCSALISLKFLLHPSKILKFCCITVLSLPPICIYLCIGDQGFIGKSVGSFQILFFFVPTASRTHFSSSLHVFFLHFFALPLKSRPLPPFFVLDDRQGMCFYRFQLGWGCEKGCLKLGCFSWCCVSVF